MRSSSSSERICRRASGTVQERKTRKKCTSDYSTQCGGSVESTPGMYSTPCVLLTRGDNHIEKVRNRTYYYRSSLLDIVATYATLYEETTNFSRQKKADSRKQKAPGIRPGIHPDRLQTHRPFYNATRTLCLSLPEDDCFSSIPSTSQSTNPPIHPNTTFTAPVRNSPHSTCQPANL